MRIHGNIERAVANLTAGRERSRQREWAEAWKATNCATGIVDEFDMLVRLSP